MSTAVYQVNYDGYYTMSHHDREENALKRWFDNYKIDRYASFSSDTEWLVVKELPSSTKRKRRFVCEIGDDGRGTKREVIIDHLAPPAPMMTFAAKRRYEPPPPKTAKQLCLEAEWSRMMSMGYEPIRRPRYRPLSVMSFNSAEIPAIIEDIEYDIEWVRRPPRSYEMPRTPYIPPPATHRRNA